jgi:hypothetical protein
MKALHIVKKNPIKNIEEVIIPTSKIEIAYSNLSNYLKKVKASRDEVTFKEHEAVVSGLVYKIGQVALSEILSHYDATSEVISVDEQTYRRKHRAPKDYQTALGPVTVDRQVYVNRKKDGNGQGICPLELQTGIIEGYWTPLAAKHAMWALAHLTTHEAEELFLQFGTMNPSRSTLDRLPKALNQHWEPHTVNYYKELINAEIIPSSAVSFSVSLDGVMIGMKPEQLPEEKKEVTKSNGEPQECLLSDVENLEQLELLPKKSMKTEWREASCGTISFFDAEGERLSTIQYGQMPEHKKVTLKTLLFNNTESILRERPELKLVHLADGAQDNWTFFDEEMPFGFQLTDFYHASEYLKDAFDAAYPKNPDKARAKFEEYKIILRDELGGISRVLRALRHLRTQYKGNKVIEASVTYFTNNQHRMHYAEAKNNNYPIGSGIVEAACKTLVGQRLKRAGMSWKNEGGQGVLTFRSLIKSARFEKSWEFVEKQYKQKVVEHANVSYLAAQNMS